MKTAGRTLLPVLTSLFLTSPLCLAEATSKKPQPEPSEFSASYSAKIGGMPFGGKGSRTFKKDGDEWVLEFGADATFFGMNETSRFKLKDGLVIPADYTYARSGIGSKAPKNARFNWKKMEALWQQDDEKSKVAIKPGTQDALSYQLQLRLDLASGKKAFSYPVADDDETYQRRLIVEGDEVLETRAGKLNTTRVKVVRDDDDRQTWIWFAKDWDYVMVKLYQKEKDSDYTIEFREGSVAGKDISGLKDK
ncbi:MAG: DUF3108 domain-containing protein [Endozoicomonas sp.]